MNKRELAKKTTKKRILETAREIFLEQGISETTTASIAAKCGIAHGTVFVHFTNKEQLVCDVFIDLLKTCALELKELSREESSFPVLLDMFFGYVADNDAMFRIYFTELPRSGEAVRRTVHSFELAVRNIFFLCLQDEGIDEKDISAVLNMLFAQLMYVQTFRDILCGGQNVTEVYAPVIKNTLLRYLSGGNNGKDL